MATRYVLFWFDVEDCTVPQSDDSAKRIAQMLTARGVRGTMKLVGQKARVLRERIRYDVIDALAQHAIGYHSNWHGLRPQPAEYMGPLDWLEGGAEFDRRERPGLDDLRDLWGRAPVCYGQPGSNWSPQVFPILRKWGLPTYVSGFGYVGLNAQPFHYGGMVNTSHMYGKDALGRPAQHIFGLNFELGRESAFAEHKRLFAELYKALSDGGLISIMNHPCTLVLEEWFSTNMKPRDLTEAGYRHFDAFLGHVLSHDQVKTITADQLPTIYPDRAMGFAFERDGLLRLARGVGGEVYFQADYGMSLSAGEMFGMFTRFLARFLAEGAAPPGETCAYLDGPALSAGETAPGFAASAEEFAASVAWTAGFLRDHGRLPDQVVIGARVASLGDYYAALAKAVVAVTAEGKLPDEVHIAPTVFRLDEHVDQAAGESAWASVMMLPGFTAPKLLDQARLQAWTLKPAILAGV